MAIVTADLVAYAAVSRADDDTDTPIGGAIDLATKVVFTDISADDNVEILSDTDPDTRTFTIVGRLASGAIATEGPTAMTGTTPVTSANSYERIHEVRISAPDGSKAVTVRKASDDVTIGTIPAHATIDGFISLFRGAKAEASATKRYEKIFWKNEHATLALLVAKVKQNADPLAKINHALADNVNDTTTLQGSGNRKTVPDGTGDLPVDGDFDDVDKSVPGIDLAAGSQIGVWLRLSLDAGDAAAPTTSTYTSELAGDTA